MDTSKEEVIQCSAKTAVGIENIFDTIIEKIPSPSGDKSAPLKALIFNSEYDNYRGAIAYIRIFEGTVKKGDKIYMFGTRKEWDVLEVGYFIFGKILRVN